MHSHTNTKTNKNIQVARSVYKENRYGTNHKLQGNSRTCKWVRLHHEVHSPILCHPAELVVGHHQKELEPVSAPV